MRTRLLLILLLYVFIPPSYSQVAVNASGSLPDSHAMLDVSSNNKGVLFPRMTSSSRIAIVTPPKGLLLYDSTTNSFWYQNGTSWVELSAASNSWLTNGSHIYNGNSGNIGIGSMNPVMKTHIVDTSDRVLLLENTTPFSPLSERSTGIYFGNNIGSVSSQSQFNGAIKSILEKTNTSRLGFFTAINASSPNLLERMTLTNYGFVGINKTDPTVELDVNGDLRSNNAIVLGGLVANGATINNNLNINGNLFVAGNSVFTSSLGTIQKIARSTASFSLSGLAPNTFVITSPLVFETFGDVPTVTLGAASNGNGNWYQVTITPAAVTNNSCVFILYNSGPTAVSFTNVSWQVLITGKK